jgi:uncharacterized membrane protein YgdD (TMEM256/DUF423 family)
MTTMNERSRIFIVLGAIAGGLGVVFGAFGAHTLGSVLEPKMLTVFETAVRYQMYHALGLIGVALLMDRAHQRSAHRLLQASGWSFLAGVILFCGSLYVLTLTGMTWLGAVTPFGGVGFIAGWALLARAGFLR